MGRRKGAEGRELGERLGMLDVALNHGRHNPAAPSLPRLLRTLASRGETSVQGLPAMGATFTDLRIDERMLAVSVCVCMSWVLVAKTSKLPGGRASSQCRRASSACSATGRVDGARVKAGTGLGVGALWSAADGPAAHRDTARRVDRGSRRDTARPRAWTPEDAQRRRCGKALLKLDRV
jgi:hypothetical protein